MDGPLFVFPAKSLFRGVVKVDKCKGPLPLPLLQFPSLSVFVCGKGIFAGLFEP